MDASMLAPVFNAVRSRIIYFPYFAGPHVLSLAAHNESNLIVSNNWNVDSVTVQQRKRGINMGNDDLPWQ